jgi:hypothetical protein
MTKFSSHSSAHLPLYARAWNRLKRFPKSLHEGAKHPPFASGGAAAFLISGGVGAAAMMVAHHLSDTSKDREAALKVLGSWIPGSVSLDPMWGNIGSYAGKETVMLIGWLGSLLILYPLLRKRDVKPRTVFFWMFSLYTLAAAMSWHPLFPYLPLQ